MDDLIHRTSHTLQLLIEYDPVRQRLDRLRLGSPRGRLGVPATSRMRLSSPSDAVLERTDVVDNGSLKRLSLRFVGQQLRSREVLMKKRLFLISHFLSTAGVVTAYASHLDQILPKRHPLLHETLDVLNHCDPPTAALIVFSARVTSSMEKS